MQPIFVPENSDQYPIQPNVVIANTPQVYSPYVGVGVYSGVPVNVQNYIIPPSNNKNNTTTVDINPPAENNIIAPTPSQAERLVKNDVSYSTGNFRFDNIFLIYLILSIIYIPVNIAINYLYLSTDILGIASLILIILGVIFFKAVKKYTKSYDSKYTVAIFIFSVVFKLLFFFVLCYYDYYTNSNYQAFDYNSLIKYKCFHVPHLLFESAGAALFFLFLIIYSKIQPEINLFIVAVLGVITAGLAFLALFFSFDQALAIIVAMLIMFEVSTLIFSICMSRKKELLINDETANNVIIIDYYKFFLLMCFFLGILLFYLLMLTCICGALGACGQRSPSYYADGRVYDFWGKDMGVHLPKKPSSWVKDETKMGGYKYFDESGKEMKESCQIF